MNALRRAAIGALGTLCLAAGPVPAASGPSTTTRSAVAAAQWADDITISIGEDAFQYQADGVPNHELPNAYVVPKSPGQSPVANQPDSAFEVYQTSEWLQITPIDVTIPLTPVYTEEPTQTSLGIIGVMISGGRLFNDYEDHLRQNVAVDDQKVIGDA